MSKSLTVEVLNGGNWKEITRELEGDEKGSLYSPDINEFLSGLGVGKFKLFIK